MGGDQPGIDQHGRQEEEESERGNQKNEIK
jgi:hypothetical protein